MEGLLFLVDSLFVISSLVFDLWLDDVSFEEFRGFMLFSLVDK